MTGQIRLLLKLALCNAGGLNTFRHTRDRAVRRRWLLQAAARVLVGAMVAGYAAALAAGLAALGMAGLIPEYLFLVSALVVLFVDLFKAGPVLFDVAGYEQLACLPVRRGAIAVSRFLVLYLEGLGTSLLVLVPGLAVACAATRPTAANVLAMTVGVLLLSGLPLTLAVLLGAAVTAISARTRRSSLAAAALTILLVLALLAGCAVLGWQSEQIDLSGPEFWRNLAAMVDRQIGRLYPPARWFGRAAGGDRAALALLAGVSVLPAALVAGIAGRHLGSLCTALNSGAGRGRFVLREQKAASPLRALMIREARRYAACSSYMTNTLIGYLLMAGCGAALVGIGSSQLEQMLGIPGALPRWLPLILGLMAVITPTTACSVSLEGKHWWLMQSLPVAPRQLWSAKLLFNLAIAAPCWLIAVGCSALALHPDPAGLACLAAVPALYIVFSALAGLRVNLALPSFDWTAEVQAVKQSAATLVTMVAGFGAAGAGAALVALLPGAAYPLLCVLLAGASLALWRSICRQPIR